MRVAWCRLIRRTVALAVIVTVLLVYLQLGQRVRTANNDNALQDSILPVLSVISHQEVHTKPTKENVTQTDSHHQGKVLDTNLITLKNDTPAEYSFRRNDFFVPSKCPGSIQKKLSANPWTSKLFHPEIKQLLTRANTSKAEYQRLDKYWMPFGFKYHQNFTYEELLAVLDLFPEVDSIFEFAGSKSRPQCISCAVVGNGGILNGSRVGKEIDGHDMVFRVNHCIRRGYEDDVGNRTTHLVLMDRSLRSSKAQDIPRDKGMKYVFMPCRKQDYRYIADVATSNNTKLKLRISPSDVRILHPDFIRYVHKIWENTKSFRPTTGGIMFFTALHAGCDSVSVYGMGFTRNFTEHYYDKEFIKFKNVKGSHDFKKEIEILNHLDQDGIIRWYKRDVPEKR